MLSSVSLISFSNYFFSSASWSLRFFSSRSDAFSFYSHSFFKAAIVSSWSRTVWARASSASFCKAYLACYNFASCSDSSSLIRLSFCCLMLWACSSFCAAVVLNWSCSSLIFVSFAFITSACDRFDSSCIFLICCWRQSILAFNAFS